jgi:hypothetical protein
VAEVDAGGLVAAEAGEELVLHPAERGVEFPEQVEARPEAFFGAAADDFAAGKELADSGLLCQFGRRPG